MIIVIISIIIIITIISNNDDNDNIIIIVTCFYRAQAVDVLVGVRASCSARRSSSRAFPCTGYLCYSHVTLAFFTMCPMFTVDRRRHITHGRCPCTLRCSRRSLEASGGQPGPQLPEGGLGGQPARRRPPKLMNCATTITITITIATIIIIIILLLSLPLFRKVEAIM